jgi:hypothetical protein
MRLTQRTETMDYTLQLSSEIGREQEHDEVNASETGDLFSNEATSMPG